MRGAERAERLHDVVDFDHRRVDGHRCAASALHDDAGRARGHCRGDEVVAVEALALDREEERARCDRAAVDRNRRKDRAVRAAHARSAGSGDDASDWNGDGCHGF